MDLSFQNSNTSVPVAQGDTEPYQDEQQPPYILHNLGAPCPTEMLRANLILSEAVKTGPERELQPVEVPPVQPDAAIDVDPEPSTVKVKPPQLTHRHQAARETILNKLHEEVHLPMGTDYVDSCCGKCCDDFLCQSRSCSIPCYDTTCSRISQLMQTSVLRKGRAQGSKNFAEAVFPLVHDVLRLLWVSIEFSLALTGLILSVLAASLGQKRAFNILHLAFNILACILAGADAMYTMKNSTTLKKLCCSRRLDNENETSCRQKCCSYLTDLIDILRLILSEAILYPLLICDIFELIVEKGFKGENSGERLEFALFVISLISLFLTVYLARVIVLVGMIKNATAVRTPTQEMIVTDIYDPDIKRSAVCYQAFFFLHVVLQMLVQIMIYITIAAKIRYDNRHFYEDGNTNEDLNVTGFLWYMIAAGYILPTMGLFTFFIATYYWSQQYPVGYRLDMISIFKMTKYGIADLSRIGEEITGNRKKMFDAGEAVEEKQAKILANIDKRLFQPLKDDFEKLFRKSWCVKFLYPFQSPKLIIACFIYFTLQLAFVVCASQAVDEMGEVVTNILNGGGWVYYFIFGVVVGAIANLYTFLVAIFWIIAISVLVIIFILLVIIFILLVIIFILLSESYLYYTVAKN